MRITIWPGVRLSLFEPQNPEAVQVTMAGYYKRLKVTRVASKRGSALFLVRYDWRDHGAFDPEVHEPYTVLRARAEQAEATARTLGGLYESAEAAIARVHEHVQNLDQMAESTASASDRRLYRALAADLRKRLGYDTNDAPEES